MSTYLQNEHTLFDKIVEEINFYNAYKQTQKGDSKYGFDAMKFAIDETYNLEELVRSLIEETYVFGGYTEFEVFEPKPRIINAPQYKDKIVQVAINNVLKEVYNPTFIYDSYACIDDKGTHKCVDRISYFIRKAKWEYSEDAYIIKMDIKKFFYTIDREILKKLLPKKIKCKKTLRLLFKIIDSADLIDLLGLPLGNTLSQICANIYMDMVDQYAKRVLSLKYYVRYADDVIIAVKNKDEANRILELIRMFIKEELHLNLNEKKTKIFPINQGVNAVGYKIYATHRLLRNDSKKKIKRKAKAMRHLILEGKMTVEKAEQILNSWKGHGDYACSYNFTESLIKRNNFIYKDTKGRLRIDVDKLEKDGGICVV